MDLGKAGLIAGAVGDVGLQFLNELGYAQPLTQYFKEQGRLLAILKASLLTGFWSWAYQKLDPTPSLPRFMTWGALVDVLYRNVHPYIYPSLDGYYLGYRAYETIAHNVAVTAIVWETAKLLS